MTAAPIYHEPSDAPELPLVPVSPDLFEGMSGSFGSVVELDPNGGPPVVFYNGRRYVAEPRTAVTSL